MTKPKKHRTHICEVCGGTIPARGRANRFCQTDACITEFARRRAWERTEKVGDCEVWQGPVQSKGATPIVTLRFNNRRRDFRVLQLRDPDPERATYRRYINSCGTPRCVNLDHHYIQIGRNLPSPQLRILARLPVEPMNEYLSRNPGVVVGPRSHKPLQQARKKGFFTVTGADAFCIDVLGVHPTAVFGDLFYTAGSEESDAA